MQMSPAPGVQNQLRQFLRQTVGPHRAELRPPTEKVRFAGYACIIV